MSSLPSPESTLTVAESPASAAKCPVDHSAISQQKTARHPETSALPLECDAQGVWQVRGFDESRAILRGTSTKQAGFNADQVTSLQGMTNRPILYQEGKVHQQQRKQTARFFAPKTVSSDYRDFMETLADQLINQLKQQKRADLSKLSLEMAVAIASRVIGLSNSRMGGMSKRLDAFFEQENPNITWQPLVKLLGLIKQRHMLSFFFLDVKPAIQARKGHPQEDVISHLLEHNYSDPEILTECVTYAAAGMATTREFISIAAWHFLEQPALRDRYVAAQEEERYEILHEMLRLEPVVGHLFRYATADIALESQGQQVVIPEGALIDLHIYATNADQSVVGEDPMAICPGRALTGDHIPAMLMAFGDGHHRCPGAFLAIQESDIFLQRLLALDGLSIERMPTLGWNEVASSYEVRDFVLALK
ncbi:MAG: cytochrome P450 [Chloroflexota bacterium]